MSIRRSILVIVIGILLAIASPLSAQAKPPGTTARDGITCNLPESDAEALIILTNVTGSKRKTADIVVHYVPTAGGVVFGGYAICGDHGCPNILVRSDLPPSLDREPYDPEYLGWVTLHELGHALGLGHATNLEESTDLMGYGWPELGDPVLSQCDVNALAFVFAWALEGSDPYPPAEGPYVCDTA